MSWTHEHRGELPGSPERVFRALTDPAELKRWFAEGAEVEPREGGPYRFWGRHTFGTPERGAAKQRITKLEKNRRLAFAWELEGEDSEVSIQLEPGKAEQETTLTLRHTFPAQPSVPYGAELVDDLWKLNMGNLDAHLRGGEGIVLPDYTDPEPAIRLSILIDASRERVFRALIEPEALNRWVASKAEVEPRAGGKYSYGWKYPYGGRDVVGGPTRILDFVPNERLVTDWTDWRGDESRGLTRVAWILEAVSEKQTRLTLIHGGFSRAADFGDYPFGWGEFARQLKREVETGGVAQPE